MLLRSVVGACAGALAGTGLALTLDGLRQYCYLRPSRTGCGDSSPLLLPPILVFWMLVAGVLIYGGVRLGRVDRGWWVTGLGSGLWVVLIVLVFWFRATYLDVAQADGHSLAQDDVHHFVMAAVVASACVAYMAAASFVGRARTC